MSRATEGFSATTAMVKMGSNSGAEPATRRVWLLVQFEGSRPFRFGRQDLTGHLAAEAVKNLGTLPYCWEMQATVLDNPDGATDSIDKQIEVVARRSPAWVAVYGVEDSPFEAVLSALRRHCPNVPVFGATSCVGVFTSKGFLRNACLLTGERSDGEKCAVSLQQGGAALASELAEKACYDIERQLGSRPNVLLLHAVPGFEERILEGVSRVYGKTVPVFGGSAADDRLGSRHRVFSNSGGTSEGFVLAGLLSPREVQGGFMAGFLPTEHGGIVTKVNGRVVQQIDGRPAAEVYNDWTAGAIEQELRTGGSIAVKTNMMPLSRIVGKAHGVQRRILSHPNEVHVPDRAMSFFSEFSEGDQVTLLTSTVDPLITRVQRTVERARGSKARRPQGALLVYCAGSLFTMFDQADRICQEFELAVDGAPFLGIATTGEQGAFFARSESWHGNLMCSTVLF